ncbi:zinc-dependent peptidase [Arsukibacterium sp.]|uniref:M90 family metallopeptidase n=1 Tax=Arsukibacterium sp. TaxID=1977258 RepID=UPI002FDB666F
MPLLILLLLASLIIGLVLAQHPWRRYQRKRIMQQAFPASWRAILKQRMPYFRALPADLQLQLKKHMQVFIAEKRFIGCEGVTVTDEMRVTIAAQACLLLLNRPDYYYPKLQQILIYPAAFVVHGQAADAAGVVSEQRRVLSGESWGQGKVVLSWQDALQGAAQPHDGRNVVIHEFAHQLDQEKGQATGAPQLSRSNDYQQWSAVMQQAFDQLQLQTANGERGLLDGYGATNPAEFFAVISEVFFEQPEPLQTQYPALYQQLSQFYRINPLSWQ